MVMGSDVKLFIFNPSLVAFENTLSPISAYTGYSNRKERKDRKDKRKGNNSAFTTFHLRPVVRSEW
jgi:hypothetical protein